MLITDWIASLWVGIAMSNLNFSSDLLPVWVTHRRLPMRSHQALRHYLARLGVEQLVLSAKNCPALITNTFICENSLMPYLAACIKPRKPI